MQLHASRERFAGENEGAGSLGGFNITVGMVDGNSKADSNEPVLQANASPFEAMFGGCTEPDRFAKWREVREWLTVSTDGSVQCKKEKRSRSARRFA